MPEYISSDVAERIKSLAKLREISVRQVLLKAGMGYNTMANMKSSMLKADNLARIADVLNCSMDYLMGRTDNPDVNI